MLERFVSPVLQEGTKPNRTALMGVEPRSPPNFLKNESHSDNCASVFDKPRFWTRVQTKSQTRALQKTPAPYWPCRVIASSCPLPNPEDTDSFGKHAVWGPRAFISQPADLHFLLSTPNFQKASDAYIVMNLHRHTPVNPRSVAHATLHVSTVSSLWAARYSEFQSITEACPYPCLSMCPH